MVKMTGEAIITITYSIGVCIGFVLGYISGRKEQ